jgi:DNA-binding transcriptional LysR family regulator
MTVQELVALKLGVSLLPASAAASDRSSVRRYLPLSGVCPSRTIAMVWHKKRHQSRLVRTFANEVRRRLVR